jgi:outer membrane protein assembly factor BamB
LLQSSQGIAAVRPITGEVVWNYTDGASTIPSSVAADGILYAVSHGITALKPPGDSASIEQLWRQGKLDPGTGSPLVYRNRLYTINRSGVLLAADLKSGEIKWQLRIPGPFSGSPVAAGGHLFVFNENGEGHCVKLGEENGELVSTSNLASEVVLCTPALSDGAIYVRSDQTLWKIAAK